VTRRRFCIGRGNFGNCDDDAALLSIDGDVSCASCDCFLCHESICIMDGSSSTSSAEECPGLKEVSIVTVGGVGMRRPDTETFN